MDASAAQDQHSGAASADLTSRRSLVLVAGPPASGTSLLAGILQQLGFHVPPPEMPADEANARGVAESRWVVDFHSRLMRQSGVTVSDARPSSWARLAPVALRPELEGELRRWLKKRFNDADHVLVKDPRLPWFLPLWRRCADELGVSPRFVTTLRHPAHLLQSETRSYGSWHGEISRIAAWLNQMLFTERATRDMPRAYVRYREVVDDWPQVVARLADELDLLAIRQASASSMRRAEQFVDPALSRSRGDWGDRDVPPELRQQAGEAWALLLRIADGDGDSEDLRREFDAARARYVAMYENAEAVARSSILAGQKRARRSGDRQHTAIVRMAERVPTKYRRRVPPRLRARLARVLGRTA